MPKDLIARALAIARPLADEIAAALAGAERGERLREGLWVVIAGPPNAGKSTLLNRIARREAAIVSPIAGTTRDVIEVHLDLNGYPVNLIDTAGIRESSDDPVEREGMRRAREQAARANLVLWVVEATEADHAGAAAGARASRTGPCSTRWTWSARRSFRGWSGSSRPWRTRISISATTGAGLDALIDALVAFAERTFTLEPALVTRERQRTMLTRGCAISG